MTGASDRWGVLSKLIVACALERPRRLDELGPDDVAPGPCRDLLRIMAERRGRGLATDPAALVRDSQVVRAVGATLVPDLMDAPIMQVDFPRYLAEAREVAGADELRKALADGADLGRLGEIVDRRRASLGRAHAQRRFSWAADVTAEAVEWLWLDRVPRSALTVLVGDPGLGKSILTCELAARVSRGQAIPPGRSPAEPATVLMLTAEDAVGAVVRPRLEQAGADLRRIALDVGGEDEPLTLPSGMAPLEAWVEEHRPALIVIDPVVAFLGAEISAHKDADVRRALRPLADLAERAGAAVVVVMHFNKAQGAQPLYRLNGSIGFAGAARSVLVFGRKPEADDTDPARIVAVAKSSYAAIAPAVELGLSVPAGASHPAVGWRGEAEGIGAADLLYAPAAGDRSAVDEAEELLRAELSDGERPAADVETAAAAAGISRSTLRRARRRAGIETRREGFGGEGRWLWALPEGARDKGVHRDEAPLAAEGDGRHCEKADGDGILRTPDAASVSKGAHSREVGALEAPGASCPDAGDDAGWHEVERLVEAPGVEVLVEGRADAGGLAPVAEGGS